MKQPTVFGDDDDCSGIGIVMYRNLQLMFDKLERVGGGEDRSAAAEARTKPPA